MRIDDPVRIVLAVVVIQDMDEYGVLQNIGVVAGVKGVSIAEQEGSLWAGAAVHKLGKYRSEEHTSELQSLMRISYAVFCLKNKKHHNRVNTILNVIPSTH